MLSLTTDSFRHPFQHPISTHSSTLQLARLKAVPWVSQPTKPKHQLCFPTPKTHPVGMETSWHQIGEPPKQTRGSSQHRAKPISTSEQAPEAGEAKNQQANNKTTSFYITVQSKLSTPLPVFGDLHSSVPREQHPSAGRPCSPAVRPQASTRLFIHGRRKDVKANEGKLAFQGVSICEPRSS